MSEDPAIKIQVIYEDGVFKPLQDIDLQEGTKAIVVEKPTKMA